jgi:hypothetical protein
VKEQLDKIEAIDLPEEFIQPRKLIEAKTRPQRGNTSVSPNLWVSSVTQACKGLS